MIIVLYKLHWRQYNILKWVYAPCRWPNTVCSQICVITGCLFWKVHVPLQVVSNCTFSNVCAPYRIKMKKVTLMLLPQFCCVMQVRLHVFCLLLKCCELKLNQRCPTHRPSLENSVMYVHTLYTCPLKCYALPVVYSLLSVLVTYYWYVV